MPASAVDPIAGLPVSDAASALLAGARDDIDAVLWRRDIRAAAAEVAAASADRGARDSAAIDGADLVLPDDSPMGKVLANALTLTAALPRHVDTWGKAPLQVLAELHAIAARDFDDQRGRPRGSELVDDPLRIGSVIPAAYVGPRLTSLSQVIVDSASPALLVAGIVHAELMALQPFAWGSGLLARAAVRLTLAGRGVDPSMFTIPEHGMLAQGRPAYVSAIRAYALGTAEGIDDYLQWFATACAGGAAAVEVP